MLFGVVVVVGVREGVSGMMRGRWGVPRRVMRLGVLFSSPPTAVVGVVAVVWREEEERGWSCEVEEVDRDLDRDVRWDDRGRLLELFVRVELSPAS